MNVNNVRLISAAFGGLLMGVGIGYKVAEKRLTVRYDERLERETADMKVFYTAVGKKKYETPGAAVADLIPEGESDPREASQKTAYHKIVQGVYNSSGDVDENTILEGETVRVVRNVFEEARDTSKPYIISQEEFMEGADEIDQGTLTYYVLDKVLTDVRDDVIDDVPATVGDEFQDNFGTGSSDENVVHIRNEKLRMDFEITKSEGSFAQDVLGEDEVPVVKPGERMSARQRRGD